MMGKFAKTFIRGFTLLELMAVVVIIGILSATAIPMLSKYMRKSKTTEAALNLRKIYDGEVSYYQEDYTTAAGILLSKAFVGATPTPAVPSEQKQLGNFETENWRMLKFSTDGPTFYSYSAIASGVGTAASFTARAVGDLDGDGRTSLFERIGNVDATGSVSGGAALYSLDTIE